MKTLRCSLLLFALALVGEVPAAEENTVATPWGQIASKSPRHELTITNWPADRLLPMKTPFPNVVSAWVGEGAARRSIHWMFNPDATQMALGLPALPVGAKAPKVRLLTTEKTTGHADGTVVLSALDAKVIGERAKLETHPGNHRIGFWINPRDYVEWAFETKEEKTYDVEIAYSRSGPPGAKLSVEFDGVKMPVTLSTTGSWYVYTGHAAGRISIPKPGRHVVRVKCVDPAGGAVMNLKAVVLRPVP